ncbi:uncharacterized protein K452DRAFT_300923 [Aplosporella prunicola CBS 121167]|uniref:Fe2OG dioxygenase domain-containing protein n=1 Tax=Aplosporella prunicola CBS 121167 TaxID=1176127 RepID=A0A6A6B5F7_9PEZI|nr:uncharacterized protein K452DRAFT_300923 [Aplosporella prunicola CBS 121167]KAF2138868.1 hypothetical protein K452DRAFT_300923 [Aplosporella prunicola CBS 121167]
MADIPVIDIATPTPAVAKQLLAAASAHGFVFVRNHDIGLPPEDIQAMFALSRTFFESPYQVKAECPYVPDKNQGWVGMQRETLDPKTQKRGDFKEAFNVGEYVDGRAAQPLPKPFAPHEAQLGRFADQCHGLCNKILRVFGMAFEIAEDEGGAEWFVKRHDRSQGPSGSILRLLYYPSVPTESHDETDIRAGAHSDYGSITLLFQLPGQPGLEILTRENAWAPVPVNPLDDAVPPILVNIGDLLSYWTDGLLRSTVHRVIFPQGEQHRGAADRYSMAYFCHPLDEARLVPVPSAIVREHGRDKGAGEAAKVLTAKDHLVGRLAATYGK